MSGPFVYANDRGLTFYDVWNNGHDLMQLFLEYREHLGWAVAHNWSQFIMICFETYHHTGEETRGLVKKIRRKETGKTSNAVAYQ